MLVELSVVEQKYQAVLAVLGTLDEAGGGFL